MWNLTEKAIFYIPRICSHFSLVCWLPAPNLIMKTEYYGMCTLSEPLAFYSKSCFSIKITWLMIRKEWILWTKIRVHFEKKENGCGERRKVRAKWGPQQASQNVPIPFVHVRTGNTWSTLGLFLTVKQAQFLSMYSTFLVHPMSWPSYLGREIYQNTSFEKIGYEKF